MTTQQPRQQSTGRDQSPQPTAGIDHSQAGLTVSHSLPRRLLVRGIPDHHRRIRVDQFTGQPPILRGAQPLDRDQPEQTSRSVRRRRTHRDVVHRGIRMTAQPCPHARYVVAGRTREHVSNHVLVQRSRQQVVRHIGGSSRLTDHPPSVRRAGLSGTGPCAPTSETKVPTREPPCPRVRYPPPPQPDANRRPHDDRSGGKPLRAGWVSARCAWATLARQSRASSRTRAWSVDPQRRSPPQWSLRVRRRAPGRSHSATAAQD